MNRTSASSARIGLMGSAIAIAVTLLANQASAQTSSQTPSAPSATTEGSSVTAADSGDIVVTAQRREQSIARVGISITAIAGDELARLGVQSTQGIAAHVPSLQFDGGSGGGLNAFVSIRGVSQVDVSEHQEAPNAVYLDEVYVPTPSMVGFPVYDLERAEALRGPQGTLFGRNSTGGLLQFITADPKKAFGGFFDASYANYNTFRLEGAVTTPLSENVALRIAGFYNKGDGYFKNLAPGGHDSFETNYFGIRTKLAVDLGEWRLNLTGSYNESPRHREGTYKSTPAYIDANGISQFVPVNVDIYGTGPGNDPYGYRDTSTDGQTGAFNDGGFLKKQYYYGTFKLSGPVGPATLTSISNYSRGKITYLEDAEGTPNNVYLFGLGGDTRQFSEELRLNGSAARFNWTIGAYYLNLKGSYYTDSNLLPPTAVVGQGPFHTRNDWQQVTNSYAIFGQSEYEFSDKLKLTAGMRFTHDQKKFGSIVYNLTSGTPVIAADFEKSTVGDLAVLSHGDWAGKVQLDFTPSPTVLLYAGVSRGIRGGGFNTNIFVTVPNSEIPFKNETVISYEGGSKLRFLDGAARLFLSAFYYDYRNFQAFNFVGTSVQVTNLPAYFYGGEAELTLKPIKNLDISLGGSYLVGKVKNVRFPNGTVASVDPVKAPKWTANGIISKAFDISAGQLRLQYDFNYISGSKANLVPSPTIDLNASTIHNARISFSPSKSGLEIYVFVRNFTDTDRKNFAYDNAFIGLNDASYAPPRTYGLGVRKTF